MVVRSPPDCTRINPTRVKLLTAAFWQLKFLNEDPQMNLKFELDVVDICENLSAVKATAELINKYENGPKKLIGIIISSPSQKAIRVSKFINSLPLKYRVVQIGIQQTAFELNNPQKYEGLFRILPDDRTQMQMICDVLYKINWNYIALLYEDDVYGREGAEFVTKCAKDANILIGVKLKIKIEELEILELDRREISGAVIIAQHSTVQRFFKKDLFGREMSFIISEAVNMYDNLFGVYSNGAVLVIQSAFSKNENFQHYWKTLFNDTQIDKMSVPYFKEMIEEISKCSFSILNETCDLKASLDRVDSRISPDDHTEAIAMGVYAIARIVGDLVQGSSETRYQEIYEKALENFQKPIDFSFLNKQLGYSKMDFISRFDKGGSPIYPKNRIFYNLFYRKKEERSDEFFFVEVGNYSLNGLQMDASVFPKYDSSGESSVEKVTCPLKYDCKKDQETPTFIYKEGDIMFMGLAPVHDRDLENGFLCRGVRSNSGYSIVEGLLFGLKELNERKVFKDLFPGKTIGMLIMDTCDSEIITMKRLFALRNNDPRICGREFNCTMIREKVIIYVGPLSSQISSVMGKIMTVQNTVQISYGATSKLLSDRNIYPNYMRTCTSDAQQVKVITDLLVEFNWKYVSLIYTDELYGHTFKEDFYDLIKKHNICLIREIPFSDSADIKEIIRLLRQRPEAKSVVLYIRSNQIKRFLEEFESYMFEDNEFTFIGSETWSNTIKLGKIAKRISGSFTLSLEIYENPNFYKYINEKVLDEKEMNPWLQDYVERECYLPLSNDKTSKKACPPGYKLKDSGFKSVWMYMALDALYVAALALNKSISEMCPKEGNVCPEMFPRIKEVIENLKKVELRNQRIFDENGDGATGYHVFRVQPDDTYDEVGYWSRTKGLAFNKGFEKPLFETKCPNKKHCSECISKVSDITRPEPEEENYSASLGIFVALLVILLAILVAFFWMIKKEKTTKKLQRERRPDGNENDDPSRSSVRCTGVQSSTTGVVSMSQIKSRGDGQDNVYNEETPQKQIVPTDETIVMK